MLKSVFRTVAFALAVLFLCATCSSAVYASSASETQENQSVRYQIIQQNNCDLVIPGATARAYGITGTFRITKQVSGNTQFVQSGTVTYSPTTCDFYTLIANNS